MIAKQQKKDIAGAASRIDRLLDHLICMFSTPATMDKTLCVVQYILVVFSTQISRTQRVRHLRFLSHVAMKGRLDHVIAGCRRLSDLINDFRTFTRLWGLLDVYSWAKDTWEKPHEDSVIKAITWSQIAAIIAFQWYENLAFLASKGVLRGARFGERRQTKWWQWSSRFWVAYIALETARLARTWQADGPGTSDDGEDPEKKDERLVKSAKWRRQACINTAWAPVSVHYSREEGCLSDDWLGVLGLVAGVTEFRDLLSDA